MNFSELFNWKSVLALGASVIGIILVTKIDSASAEKVLMSVIDTCKENMVAVYSNH